MSKSASSDRSVCACVQLQKELESANRRLVIDLVRDDGLDQSVRRRIRERAEARALGLVVRHVVDSFLTRAAGVMALRRHCGWWWWLRKGQSDPATPAGSRHSCQPTVKLHMLPLGWNFPLGKG